MPESRGEQPWVDERAGRLVRPYTVSDGRTRPTSEFNLLTMVMATGAEPAEYPGPDHCRILELARTPVSVAELAAQLRLPATVVKVLLSDLVDLDVVTTRDPAPGTPDPTDPDLLEAVLHGLRTRL
ncbi:DUF742 domain-containing protein [Streptomyces calidiresistens]|uniref:DUF742 domain-containing protein n=1 Tax=Streptomyces calidiresistens TaxID=1485586 RepID=A0A7W3XXF7_9ACTN|nr:DUF742 domain-containing protein [Streptomyces calidiresistens]MBB0230782.1 DUF742 domain-containing protein [Streptomyces calidiresistens]